MAMRPDTRVVRTIAPPPLGILKPLLATSTSRASMFLMAVLMAVSIYGLVFVSGILFSGNRAFVIHFERGPIPFLSTFLFALGISILLHRYAHIAMEWSAFGLEDQIFPSDQLTTISRDVADSIGAKVRMLPPRSRNLLLPQRLDRSLQRLRNTGSSAEMGNVLNDLSTIDRYTSESSYTTVKFILALIPILGFIGTVMGISDAISGFASAISTSENFEALRGPLKGVTGHLGVAFETTLLALIQSGLVMLLHSRVQKREDDVLTAVDDYCITKVLNRLKVGAETGAGAESLKAEIAALNVSMIEKLQDIEAAVRETNQEICIWLRRMADTAPPRPTKP